MIGRATIVCVGKLKEAYWRDACEEYRKRLTPFFRTEISEVEDMARAGLVVGLEPSPGVQVPVPARLVVRVSSGPPLVEVPDLLGLHEAELPSALAAARLELGEVTRELRLMLEEGEVVSQTPPAGDSLRAGSGVDVVVVTTRIEMRLPEDFLR